MSKLFLRALFLLLVVPANLYSNHQPIRVQLLEVGEFHGDEVTAKTSNGWLGLFVTKKHSSLAPISIQISRVFDPIIDDESTKKTGKKVSIQKVSTPVLLIKNAPYLKAGQVITALEKIIRMTAPNPILLNLGNQQYQVIAQPFILGKGKVELSQGKIKQTIFSELHNDAGGFSILWAGDLDGDGKLDLYINAASHDNLESKRLLLSSQANKGQLVREIARFETTGC